MLDWKKKNLGRLPAAALLLLAAAACLSAPPVALAAGRGAILIYGDSLAAAYGISQKEGWAALLQERLRKERFDYSVVNASISGETASGGASRVADVLARERPAVMVVELGANDGLRGLPVSQMRENLTTIITSARKAGSKVLLVGMRIPPNYGSAYTAEFQQAFAALARQHRIPLVPFLLEGIAEKRELFQADQMHPSAAAQAAILENVWKGLRPLLKK